jgi:hypothetical protein
MQIFIVLYSKNYETVASTAHTEEIFDSINLLKTQHVNYFYALQKEIVVDTACNLNSTLIPYCK